MWVMIIVLSYLVPGVGSFQPIVQMHDFSSQARCDAAKTTITNALGPQVQNMDNIFNTMRRRGQQQSEQPVVLNIACIEK